MGHRREGDGAHEGKTGAYQLRAIRLDPQACALPCRNDGENSGGDIGERPDIATQYRVDREDRIPWLKKAPDIEQAGAIEKLRRANENAEDDKGEDRRENHAPDIGLPRHPLMPARVDEVGKEQGAGRVFAERRRTERQRCRHISAEKKIEPQHGEERHCDVVVTLGDGLADAGRQPAENQNRESTIDRGVIRAEFPQHDERCHPGDGDHQFEEQEGCEGACARKNHDRGRHKRPQRPIGHGHREMIEGQGADSLGGKGDGIGIDAGERHAAPNGGEPQVLGENRVGQGQNRHGSESPEVQRIDA